MCLKNMFKGTVGIAGRTITNLRFADDIDGLAGSEQELAQLVERIDQTSQAYGMEINAEKTQLMTNNINSIHKEIKASGQKLQRIKAVEMRCYRRLVPISYKDHITDEIVCKKIQAAIGPYEDILTFSPLYRPVPPALGSPFLRLKPPS